MLARSLLALLTAVLCTAPAIATAGAAPGAETEVDAEISAPVDSAPGEAISSSQSPFEADFEAHRRESWARASSEDAALPLLRAFALRDRLPTLAPLARLFGGIAGNSSSPPNLRALARHLLLEADRSRGRISRADQHAERLGFLTRFQVIGPFDNEGKTGCATEYPPEKELDLAGRYPGKGREIGWRGLPDATRTGYVDLGAAISPSDETVTYALSVIDAKTDQNAVFHLGTSGAARLWVNGVRVWADDSYHPPRFDQAHVGVPLRKGANRVLLKLCQNTGPYGFFLRATGPKEETLDVVARAPDAIEPAPKGVRGQPLPNLVDHFRRRAEASRNDPRARAAYAEMLMRTRAFDQTQRRDAIEAAHAARLAPRDAEIQLLAARTSDDANERRRYLEAALAIAPNHPEAALALAEHQLDHERPRRALELLDGALSANPGWYPLALLRARALDNLGMSVRAEAQVREVLARFPDRPEVLREAALLERRSGRPRDAAALYRLAIGLRYNDTGARQSLSAVLADLGDVRGALKEQRELNELEPWNVRAWLRTAELAAANGAPDEASAAFARARALAPDEAEVFEREGRARALLGDDEGAAEALTRALALRPQDPRLKEAIKAVRGESLGFGEELLHDARELAARHPATTGEDAVVLAELTAIKVFKSGLAARLEQRVVRVQTARGVEAERNQWVTYSPDRQDLNILRARVVRPDGAIIDTHAESERSLSDDASKLYYDARGRIITFPGLAPGDVLELVYRLDDTASDNLLSDYFGDVQLMQGEHRKANWDYYLMAPPGRTIYASQPSVETRQERQPQPDGAVLHHWSARELPRVVPEPNMPGVQQVAATLHVSTYKDWDSVGRYYWGLVRDQLTPNDEVRAVARELQRKVPAGDDLAMIRAVYDFVVTRTRYVGLEFGIHGFKPYKVSQVLARRFGDCKDKASLMHALLEVAGIDSRLVLLRMKRLGQLAPEPASLAVFDHAILYVPKYDLYLDGTAELHGSMELPVQDRGATVLVVEPKGGSKLGRIPDARAADNAVVSHYEVTLGADGAAVIEGRSVVTGLFAPEYRHRYQAPATRKQRYEQGWARSFPGLSVKELTFSDLTDIEKPVELEYAMAVPHFAQEERGALTLQPFGQSRTYVEAYAPLSSRKLDLVLAYPWTTRSTYLVRLPEGFGAPELPAPVEVMSPFGSLSMQFRLEGRELTIDSEVALGVSTVAASEYPAFRAFLGQIDQALGRQLKLSPAAATPPSTSR